MVRGARSKAAVVDLIPEVESSDHPPVCEQVTNRCDPAVLLHPSCVHLRHESLVVQPDHDRKVWQEGERQEGRQCRLLNENGHLIGVERFDRPEWQWCGVAVV